MLRHFGNERDSLFFLLSHAATIRSDVQDSRRTRHALESSFVPGCKSEVNKRHATSLKLLTMLRQHLQLR